MDILGVKTRVDIEGRPGGGEKLHPPKSLELP